jgi:hypothetical protein
MPPGPGGAFKPPECSREAHYKILEWILLTDEGFVDFAEMMTIDRKGDHQWE